MAVDLSFTDESQDTGAGNPFTFASQSFGAEAADRQILVLGFCRDADAGEPTFDAFTIGGVSATEILLTTGSTVQVFAYIASVPTGTTGNIVIDLNESVLHCAIAVYRVVGATTTIFDTGSDVAADQDLSISIDTPAGGAIAAFSISPGADTSITWTNLTEDCDVFLNDGTSDSNYSSASAEFASTQTGLSITGNWAAGTAQHGVAVSFEPTAAAVSIPVFMENYRRRREGDN